MTIKYSERQDIALLVGGHSTEYDASIMSYLNIRNECLKDDSSINIKKVFFINNGYIYVHTKNLPKNEKELSLSNERHSLDKMPALLKSSNLYILNLLHGNEGESGAYQGIAEIFDIRGSFGSVLASSLTMNKWQAGEFATSISMGKLKPIPYMRLTLTTPVKEVETFLEKHESKYFVLKPNSLGASLFTYKINRSEVIFRLQSEREIFNYDRTFILQQYIEGRELTVGLVQTKEELIVLPIIEALTKDRFLGHKEKHENGYVIPRIEGIEIDLKNRLKELSIDLFHDFGISDFCRFDFLYADGHIYFLEVNTIPGIMKQSSFTYMLKLEGISIPKLISWFIDNDSLRPYITKTHRYSIQESE